MNHDFLDTAAIAHLMGVTRRHVYWWIWQGYLKATNYGKRMTLITRSDYEDFRREYLAGKNTDGGGKSSGWMGRM
jgi:hypothetical protein